MAYDNPTDRVQPRPSPGFAKLDAIACSMRAPRFDVELMAHIIGHALSEPLRHEEPERRWPIVTEDDWRDK